MYLTSTCSESGKSKNRRRLSAVEQMRENGHPARKLNPQYANQVIENIKENGN
jgi:hypothetical protein